MRRSPDIALRLVKRRSHESLRYRGEGLGEGNDIRKEEDQKLVAGEKREPVLERAGTGPVTSVVAFLLAAHRCH